MKFGTDECKLNVVWRV